MVVVVVMMMMIVTMMIVIMKLGRLELADYGRLHDLVHDLEMQLFKLVHVARRFDQLDKVLVGGCVCELVVEIFAHALASRHDQ